MRQLTIRTDEELARHLQVLAEDEGISLNKAAIRLLRKGAGLDQARPASEAGVIGGALDGFIGALTVEDAECIDTAVRECRTIEAEMWR